MLLNARLRGAPCIPGGARNFAHSPAHLTATMSYAPMDARCPVETCQCLEAVAQSAGRAASVTRALPSVVSLVCLWPPAAVYTRAPTTRREKPSILGLDASLFATARKVAWFPASPH
ncbi:rCG53813, partial [Rattus norvegicus]